MKTSDLIKQAEELLVKIKKTTDENAFDCSINVGAFSYAFVCRYSQELIDRLKRYEEALNKIKIRSRHGFEAVPFDVQELVRKALEEE